MKNKLQVGNRTDSHTNRKNRKEKKKDIIKEVYEVIITMNIRILIRERFEIQLSIKISEYKRRFELILSSLSSE